MLAFLAGMTSGAEAAKEFPPFGGPGTNFRDECPTGQFLVGARARSGMIVDQISITCAPLDANLATGQPPFHHGPARGGNGGVFAEKTCLPNHIATGAGLLMYAGDTQVRLVIFNCKSTSGTARHNLDIGNAPFFPDVLQTCPDGEAIVGIQGRTGNYVNALGMICGKIEPTPPPRPEQASRPEPAPRPEACRNIAGDPVPKEWADMLAAHNEKRKLHCVAPLTWSSRLAEAAQSYANECNFAHGAQGENLANHVKIVNGVPADPAATDREAFENTWYCEVNNYDFNNPQFVGGFTSNCQNVNGHFTQIVWKDTCELGCGRATCTINGQQGTHWVCRYSPPGNMNTQDVSVLKDQVRPADCTE